MCVVRPTKIFLLLRALKLVNPLYIVYVLGCVVTFTCLVLAAFILSYDLAEQHEVCVQDVIRSMDICESCILTEVDIFAGHSSMSISTRSGKYILMIVCFKQICLCNIHCVYVLPHWQVVARIIHVEALHLNYKVWKVTTQKAGSDLIKHHVRARVTVHSMVAQKLLQGDNQEQQNSESLRGLFM